jgi:hypothetical protein
MKNWKIHCKKGILKIKRYLQCEVPPIPRALMLVLRMKSCENYSHRRMTKEDPVFSQGQLLQGVR